MASTISHKGFRFETASGAPRRIHGTASLYRDDYGSTFILNPQRGFVPVNPTTSRATRFELVERLAIRYRLDTFTFEGHTFNTIKRAA